MVTLPLLTACVLVLQLYSQGRQVISCAAIGARAPSPTVAATACLPRCLLTQEEFRGSLSGSEELAQAEEQIAAVQPVFA